MWVWHMHRAACPGQLTQEVGNYVLVLQDLHLHLTPSDMSFLTLSTIAVPHLYNGHNIKFCQITGGNRPRLVLICMFMYNLSKVNNMYTCLVQVLDLASRCLDRRYLMILSLPPKMTGPTSKNDMILKKDSSCSSRQTRGLNARACTM